MKAISNFRNFLEKNSVVILTGIAVGGTITTAIFASNAGIKAISIIRENNITDPKDKIKATWKCYIPTGIIISTTVISIIGINRINNRRNAALATLYSIAQKTFKEYQDQVVKQIGSNKEQKIRDGIDRERILNNPPEEKNIIFSGGDVICYDPLTGRYFQSDIEKIRKIVNELNRRLIIEMYISLNEFHNDLGLASTNLGNDLGFDIDHGLLEVNYSSQLTKDEKPCLVLNYKVVTKNLK